MSKIDAHICSSCNWLVLSLGFLHRKKKFGPCDRCLGEWTTMQQAMEDKIWIRYIPPKISKEKQDGKSRTDKSA